ERVADIRGLFSLPGVFQQLVRFPSVQISSLPLASTEATCHLRVESVERFSGNVAKLRDELATAAAGDRVLIACHNEAECKRLGELFGGKVGAPDGESTGNGDRLSTALSDSHAPTLPLLVVGRVRAGFRLVGAGLVVLR